MGRPLRGWFVGLLTLAMAGCQPSAADAPQERIQPPPRPIAASAPPRLAIGPDADRVDVSSIVGKVAPSWDLSTWFNGPPRRVEDLRGRVVLVRWFMSTECAYCNATAPALVGFHDAYASRGLTVVGMYHHKSESPLVLEDVEELAVEHHRFRFPIAVDEGWKTLRRWWLDAHPDGWTSLSFLVDRRGTVRFVHLGGEYAPNSADHAQMKAWIEELLAEPVAP